MENNSSIFKLNDNDKMYSSSAWMLTLSDLLALLLVFFILIYSMSSIRTGEWDKIMDSMGEAFNSDKIVKEKAFSTSLGVSKVEINIGLDLNYLYSILENKINENSFLSEKIGLDYNQDKLVISLKNTDLFRERSAQMNQDAELILFIIGDVLQKINNKIEVVGYLEKKTDRTAIMDNWRLALERATHIAEEMRKYGNLSKMNAVVNSYKTAASSVNYNENLVNIIILPYAREF